MNDRYRKMLDVMKAKEMERKKESRKKKNSEPWHLYILKCNDGTFYTGIAKDLGQRIQKHHDGTAAKYTRTRRPIELLYHEKCISRTAALIRECAVKALPRKKKEELTGQHI